MGKKHGNDQNKKISKKNREKEKFAENIKYAGHGSNGRYGDRGRGAGAEAQRRRSVRRGGGRGGPSSPAPGGGPQGPAAGLREDWQWQ